MKVNYFDLGLFRGVELSWMVNNILPSLDINDYSAYGFEPCEKYFEHLSNKFNSNDKITLIKKAVSDKNQKVKLYHAPNLVGNSIYDSKNNIKKDSFEMVESIIFSEWLKKNVQDFENSFNILKVNIEGAEWPLFKNLCETGMHKHIDIFCGQGHDVKKIGEFVNSGVVENYYNLLEEYDIVLHRFSEYKPEQNIDMKKMIMEKLWD